MGATFKGTSGCSSPSEIWSDPAEIKAISDQVEKIIVNDFSFSKAAIGAIETFVDPGVNGPVALTDFLARHSFGRVIDRAKMAAGFAAGSYAVPDIVTSRGALGKSEHYEIKGKSSVNDGLRQVVQFAQLNKDFNLLFFPGTEYDPIAARFFSHIDTGMYSADIELKWFREAPGLILYELCHKLKFKDLKMEATKIMFVALMAFLFARALKNNPGGVPVPGT
jgi:hypothetical protein